MSLTLSASTCTCGGRGCTSSTHCAPSPDARSFHDLEQYLATALDQQERLRLKLLNPLGVGLRIVERVLAGQAGERSLLDEDLLAIDDIERQQATYREDMSREFRHRLSSVDNVLHGFERRGVAFSSPSSASTTAPSWM